jgi:hypothetical protein
MDLEIVAEHGRGIVQGDLVPAELSAQVLRQTPFVERGSHLRHVRRRHDVADVLDSRPGRGESLLDALGRKTEGLHQLDRPVAAAPEGGVVSELGLLTA